jgi:hypothetical protein
MKYLLIFLLFVQSVYVSVFSQAQTQDVSIDYDKLHKAVTDEYGFDQVLVNGIFFTDKYLKKEGHQFLMEDQLYKGNLTFRGREYKGLEMKYDIYNHQLLLFVKNNISAAWVVPPNDFISAFSLGGKSFSKYNFQGEPGFYQVVFDTEKLKCLYYWYKKMHESYDKSNHVTYEFFKGEKRCYLLMNGSLLTYRNNRSFMELLPGEIKYQVRKFLSANHIKVNKSSDEKISELLVYCNSLY